MKVDVIYEATREIEAAKVLRAQISDLADGEEDFIRDTLEGEVDFEGIVASLLASIGEDEAHEAGLKAYIDEMKARKDRFGKRADTKRALIANALEIAGRKKIETPVATVSLTAVKPKAIVTEEGDIPSDYWKPQAPKLDLTALSAALREGAEVPGATLSNGGFTVTVRRR
jgi:LPS O-antigen subunit length determinant protein (WzzB/FepE family)